MNWKARRGARCDDYFSAKGAVVGIVVIVTFILLALLARGSYPMTRCDQLDAGAQPPSGLHWFGTDDLGRDIFGRVIYGARRR